MPYDTYLICYDIADTKRLRRVARLMETYGTRVQRSVFVCRLKPGDRDRLERRLGRLICPETDAVSLYRVCRRCEESAVYLGTAFGAEPVPACVIV